MKHHTRIKFARSAGRMIAALLFVAALGPLVAQESKTDTQTETSPASSAPASASPRYRAGRLLVEARGTYGLGFGGSIYENYRDQNLTFPVGPLTLFSGNAASIAVSYLTRRAAPEAAMESVGGSFGVEYALWDWLGIGLSAGQTSYSLKNARIISSSSEIGFVPVGILSSNRQALINAELLYPFFVSNTGDFDRIASADLNLAFHPLGGEGRVDPYLKAIGGYGRTKADGFQAIRYGGALGLRFFINDWFYVVTEAAYINNEISGKVDTSVGIFQSSSEFEGNLREISGQLGFGFAFF